MWEFQEETAWKRSRELWSWWLQKFPKADGLMHMSLLALKKKKIAAHAQQYSLISVIL